MKAETWIFMACAIFLALVTPAYWLLTGEWAGSTALLMTTLLLGMVAIYLGSHARRMDEPRPEDRKEAEIADGAGELGFYPPYSWWPFYCALCFSTIILGIVFGWWLFIIGLTLGAIALSGWIFEYYRGEHAH